MEHSESNAGENHQQNHGSSVSSSDVNAQQHAMEIVPTSIDSSNTVHVNPSAAVEESSLTGPVTSQTTGANMADDPMMVDDTIEHGEIVAEKSPQPPATSPLAAAATTTAPATSSTDTTTGMETNRQPTVSPAMASASPVAIDAKSAITANEQSTPVASSAQSHSVDAAHQPLTSTVTATRPHVASESAPPAPMEGRSDARSPASVGAQSATATVDTESESSRARSGLNVRDALVYLEEVKRQFADKPDVYSRFLDIMKEFKSHAIDTPGVIERVLDLFGDNLALIIGFNTFLPPGFQIDTDDSGVRVTTPQYSRIHHFTTSTSAKGTPDVRRSTTEPREGESGNVLPVAATANNANNEGVDRQTTAAAATTTVQPLPPIKSPDQYDTKPNIANYAASTSNIHAPTSNISNNGNNNPAANYNPSPSASSSSVINANGPGTSSSTTTTATTTPNGNYPGVSSQSSHPHYTKTATTATAANHAPSSSQASTTAPSGPMTSIHQNVHGVSNYPVPPSTNMVGGQPAANAATATTTAMGGRTGGAGGHRNSISAVSATAASIPSYGAMPSQAAQPLSSQSQQPPTQQQQQQQQPPPQPAEFNHAITFVNKIKNRFASQPDIYKQFLEILQQYQKENKPLKEVYAHVQILFRDAEDLLAEFKQFLPDPAATATTGTTTNLPTAARPPVAGMGTAPRLPPVGTFSAHTAVSGNANAMAAAPVPAAVAVDPYRAGAYANASSLPTGATGAGRKKRDSQANAADATRKRQRQVVSLIGASNTGFDARTSASADELVFFERVKRHLTNKQTYVEFIKILNLFSQEILDRKQVVERAEPFLSNRAELYEWFKMFVGYDGKQEVVINEAPPREKLDLSKCKQASNSYRVLPVADQRLPCSGRDDLASEVINNKYVSHPIWASEDQEFIAHRKNQFEEAMHRCEEERYEYDLYIEANIHTIALLEPIARRIETMTAEERAAFRLPDGLGGQSRTIYKRIIKRVYDDRAPEIIEQLQNNPANTVPIVLARLKHKDDEWRKAQRESNKIWRDVEARNYYKSLDHQGIHFKGNDKRTLSPKAFLEKIEAIYKEQMAARRPGDPRPTHQYEYDFNDIDLSYDVACVLMACMDRQSNISHADREHVEDFILGFIKDMFGLPAKEPEKLGRVTIRRIHSNNNNNNSNNNNNNNNGSGADEAGSDVDRDDALSVVSHDSDMDSASPGRRTRGRENSLRRDVLRRGNTNGVTNGQSSRTEESSTMNMDEDKPEDNVDTTNEVKRAESTSNTSEMAVDETPIPATSGYDAYMSEQQQQQQDNHDGQQRHDTWIQVQRPGNTSDPSNQTTIDNGNGTEDNQRSDTSPATTRPILNCYGNNAFYIFFRLYQTLYSRLQILKQHANNEHYRRKLNSVAVDLAMQHRPNSLNDYNLDVEDYYQVELDLIARLITQDIDKTTFEDNTRYLFGTKGYVLFTISHLAQSILRQIQTIVNDHVCLGLMDIFRQYGRTGSHRQTAYWARAEGLLNSTDDQLFRFEFDFDTRQLRIQYIDHDDQFGDDPASREERWLRYLESYVGLTPTVGVSVERQPFVKWQIPEDPPKIDSQSFMMRDNMEVKICANTYRMFFMADRCDWLIRRSTFSKSAEDKAQSLKRDTQHRYKTWKRWLNGPNGWKRDLTDPSADITRVVSDAAMETTNENEDNSNANNDGNNDDMTDTDTNVIKDPIALEAQCLTWLQGTDGQTIVEHIDQDEKDYRIYRQATTTTAAAAVTN